MNWRMYAVCWCLLLLVTTGIVSGASDQERTITLPYVIYGNHSNISYTVYKEIHSQFTDRDAHLYSNTENQTYQALINDPVQDIYLRGLVDTIKLKSDNPEEQARIAVSIVQRIAYKTDTDDEVMSPYEVLYLGRGSCSGKSLLLAYLLKNLGYGTELFVFREENHMAVGIKTVPEFAFKQTEYAYIESTRPSIMTGYGAGQNEALNLTSDPIEFPVSGGMTFTNLSRDAADVRNFTNWRNSGSSELPPLEYREWETIIWFHGLEYGGSYIYSNPYNRSLCSNGEQYCNNKCWNECANNTTPVCNQTGLYCEKVVRQEPDDGKDLPLWVATVAIYGVCALLWLVYRRY